MLRQQIWDSPAPKAAENISILAAVTLPTSGTSTSTTFLSQPDVVRTIRFKGNQSSTQGLVVTVNGTDIRGNTLTEAVTMGGAFATPTDSLNAFASITSIVFPTRGASGDTISVGDGASLGLDDFTDAFSFQISPEYVTSNTTSLTVIPLNVAILAATLDGSTAQALPYIPASFAPYGRIWG